MPKAFIQHMKDMLGAEFPDFEAAIHEQPSRGVRVAAWNGGQGQSAAVPDALKATLEDKIPWTTSGYYIRPAVQLGKTVFHEAGALYLQEPSAMAIASLVEPKPDERILDLCAAPGGKTSALASLMEGSGQLIANEIHRERVRILAENMERMGAHVAITNDTPDALARLWPEQFDAILVDAPCSGEGMFRKNPEAAASWYTEAPQDCAKRQRDILQCAVKMLRPGGRLIYSTCTFNEYENEQIVAWLEDEYQMITDELPDMPGWSQGRPDYVDHRDSLLRTRRLWPHLARGEGHFAARLIKPTDVAPTGSTMPERSKTHSHSKSIPLWDEWLDESGIEPFASWRLPVVHKDMLFANIMSDLPQKGLHVLRAGTPLASVDRGRLTPSLGLSRCIKPIRINHHLFISVTEEEALQYFRGDALSYEGDKRGFVVPTYEGLPLGFAKAVPGRLNNLYPKGLRKSNLLPIHLT